MQFNRIGQVSILTTLVIVYSGASGALAGVATMVKHVDDFYTGVNADWLENTPILEDLPGLDNFTQVTVSVNALIRDTLEG